MSLSWVPFTIASSVRVMTIAGSSASVVLAQAVQSL